MMIYENNNDENKFAPVAFNAHIAALDSECSAYTIKNLSLSTGNFNGH